MRTDSVFDEPRLRSPDRPPPPEPDDLSDAVWDEPAIRAAGRPPPDLRATSAGWPRAA